MLYATEEGDMDVAHSADVQDVPSALQKIFVTFNLLKVKRPARKNRNLIRILRS
jgi:hypothetical protein